MDTSTLVIAHTVLSRRGIREAARALNKPVSSIAAAIRRLEAEISVPLLQRAGNGLVLTLEAERLLPDIALLAGHIDAMMATGGLRPLERGIGLQSLGRFCEVAEAGSIRRAAL